MSELVRKSFKRRELSTSNTPPILRSRCLQSTNHAPSRRHPYPPSFARYARSDNGRSPSTGRSMARPTPPFSISQSLLQIDIHIKFHIRHISPFNVNHQASNDELTNDKLSQSQLSLLSACLAPHAASLRSLCLVACGNKLQIGRAHV